MSMVVTRTVLLLALAACVLGCSAGERRRASASEAAAVPRVVSLHEVTTEMVVALGAEVSLVGLEDPVDPGPELAAAMARLARVPRVDGLETILAVHPTVVLGMQTIADHSPELVAELRQRGVEVWLGDPASLDDVHRMVREVAKRSGVTDGGAALIARLEAKESQGAAGAAAGRRPRRVFVYDCCDPPFTAGGKTVLTDVIRRAGGVNVFADVADDWTHVSWEAAVERAPDLAIVNAYAMDGQGDVAAKVATLHHIAGWEQLPVVVLPLGEALGGLRSVDGLRRLGDEFAKLGAAK